MMRFLRRTPTTSGVNPLAQLSDDELVAEHCKSGVNSHFLSELIRRLMRSNERLSAWLLVFTVAIFLLTVVLVWVSLRPSPTNALGTPWVLWVSWVFPDAPSHLATGTITVGGFTTKDECERARADRSQQQTKQSSVYCLPATIDPREPKGR